MEVVVTSFWLPKAGNTEEEYEDAFSPTKYGKRMGEVLHFAAADGATEGMLSGNWAKILLETFCRFRKPHANPRDFLEKAYKRWNSWKKNYLDKREKQNRPIQWFEEPGLQAGAFSTFLGLTLIDFEDLSGKWEAVALGDTCLFQTRDDSLTAKFPIEHSSEFNNRPVLICSNKNKNILDAMKTAIGDWCAGDRFYLMTDALASWFLQECEKGKTPWKILHYPDIDNQQKKFKELMYELRASKQIRNDDLTLLCIDIVQKESRHAVANRNRLSRSDSES